MKKVRYYLGAAVLTAVLFAGCGKKSDNLQTVRSKLNENGSYYLLADQTYLKSQLDFMLDRVEPSAQALMSKNAIPFSFADLRKKAAQFCTIAGLDQIQAYGASSMVLSGGKNQQPYFFHNRFVVSFDGNKLPPFMLPFTGKKVAFSEFAAVVPDDAVSAGIMPINFAAVYKFLKAGKYLPENIPSILRSYLESDPEKFLVGISGEMTAVMWNFSGTYPRVVYIINDQDNRLFKLCGKYLLFDADKVAEHKFPVPESEIVLRKKAGKLYVFIGNGLAAHYDRKISAGQTMAKRPALAKYTAMLPDMADGFGINCYSQSNVTGSNLAAVSAMIVEQDSVTTMVNSFCDWNGWAFEIVANVVPQLESILNMVQQN